MSDIKIVVGAVDNASRVLSSVRSSLADVQATSERLTNVLGTLGVSLSAGAAVAWIRNINNGVDALNDLKDATGASIENISGLEDVAARTGTSFDTVGAALTKFNKVLNDAKPGSEAEASLKALGLSAKELKAIDPAEALLKYAQAINGFADDGNKARLVQEQLGKSYRELAPFLKDLAEAGKLNAKVTTEQAEEAERFNRQLFELEKNAKDASRALVSDLVIGLNNAAKAMRENGSVIEWFRTLLTGDDQHKNNVKLTEQTNELLQLERDISELRASGTALDAASARKKEERLKVLQGEIKTTMAYRQLLAEGAAAKVEPPKPGVTPPPVKTKGKSEVDKEQDAIDRYIKSLTNELETAQKLTEEQKALNFLKTLGAAGELEKNRESVLLKARQVDGIRSEAEAQRILEEARKPHAKYLADLAQEQLSLEETTAKMREHVEEIGLTKEQLDALHLTRMDNLIATEKQNLADLVARNGDSIAIALLQQKIELLKEQRALTAQGQVKQAQADSKAEQDKASKEFADTLRNDLKGAFSAAFRDSKDPLKAFGDALENIIYTRAATALSEALMEYLAQMAASSAASSSGSGGDLIGTLMSWLPSFDGGGSTGSGSRSGGIDGKGGFLSLLHPNETVLDHTRGQGAGGAVSVVQNITIDSRSDQASILAAMEMAKNAAIRAIADSRARGGAFA